MKQHNSTTLVVLTVLMLMLLPLMASASSKKLIEFGCDMPNTAFLKEHITEMEKMPFDGVVLTALCSNGQDFQWTFFGTTAIEWESLKPAVEDLKATKFTRFTDNFLRINMVPGNVDWFEDFSAIIHNARMTARFCKETGLKGILFDVEAYNGPLFAYSPIEWLHYPGAKYVKTHSYEEYAAKVRRRGEEIMEAFQAEDYGLTIFLSHGYPLAFSREGGAPGTGNEKGPKDFLSKNLYGMLGPFLDGFYSAARGKTKIIDGYEQSYSFHKPEEFKKAYHAIRVESLEVCENPKVYNERISAAFGLWIDSKYYSQTEWGTSDFSKNAFTPQEWQKALSTAFSISDEYVWVYSDRPRWWPPQKGLPKEYIDATRNARR